MDRRKLLQVSDVVLTTSPGFTLGGPRAARAVLSILDSVWRCEIIIIDVHLSYLMTPLWNCHTDTLQKVYLISMLTIV